MIRTCRGGGGAFGSCRRCVYKRIKHELSLMGSLILDIFHYCQGNYGQEMYGFFWDRFPTFTKFEQEACRTANNFTSWQSLTIRLLISSAHHYARDTLKKPPRSPRENACFKRDHHDLLRHLVAVSKFEWFISSDHKIKNFSTHFIHKL